jgi:hypothetical protein
MMGTRTTSHGVFVALLCAGTLLAAEEDKKAVHADFKIVAEYRAGLSHWKWWRSTITGDGQVTQEILFAKGTKKKSRLSEDDLKAILAQVKEADFFALGEHYRPSPFVTDCPTLILTVTRDKKTHKVDIYAPHLLKNDKEVKRFFRVWSEVLKKAPSPNPEQKPELDKP